MKNVQCKRGDLVRVHRMPGEYHGIKSGTVCEVIDTDVYGDGTYVKVRTVPGMYVEGSWTQGMQVVQYGHFKLAKQAQRQRHLYNNRRG